MSVASLEQKRVEIREREAMESISSLMDFALKNPRAACDLIGRHAQCAEAYPENASTLFMLGMVYGMLAARTHTPLAKQLDFFRLEASKGYTVRPCDVLGEKRMYFKTGHFPVGAS
jgi:hypothetical protein